jgi:hypothetical protein
MSPMKPYSKYLHNRVVAEYENMVVLHHKWFNFHFPYHKNDLTFEENTTNVTI